MRPLRIAALALLLPLSGCLVRTARPAPPPPPCPGAAWVEGHTGPYGHWHPGHWICPAPRPVVVVPG